MRQPRDNWCLCGIEVHLWHGSIKNRIRKGMLAVFSLSVSLSSHHLTILSSTAALITSLLLREGAEVCLEQLGVMSCLNTSFKPGCLLNHANIFFWVYFQFSIMNIVCTTKDKGPAISNLFLSSFHVPGPLCLFRLIKSKLITLSTVLLLLQLALNWLHQPARVETSSLKKHLLF